MSPLQWALLVVGAAAVIGIYLYFRRGESGSRRQRRAPMQPSPTLPGVDQMEMFGRNGEFDEFGVGKPRKRVAPTVAGELAADAVAVPAATSSADVQAASPSVEEKLVTLLIAEREGTAIFGPKIHTALKAQNLRFGDKRIYHRYESNQVVYSVASLIKPGYLDPAEQTRFSAPGLTLFMVLPGPSRPQAALADMLGTARALAQRLNAEVYDANRQLLSEEAEAALVADVETWAQRHGL